MLRLPQDVGAVVDAVYIYRLAIVILQLAMMRWLQPNHSGQRRPAVDMGHHLAVFGARRDVIGPPHDSRDPPAGFKRAAFLSTEGMRSGVGEGVLPRSVVGREDDDRVRRLGPNGVHDPA